MGGVNWGKALGMTVFGLICGAIVGTIVASVYIELALRSPLSRIDMFAVWKVATLDVLSASDMVKVAMGLLVGGTLAFGLAAFVWTVRRQSSEYGSAHWQTKIEMRKNEMLGQPGAGFIVGKLGEPDQNAPYIVSKNVPHVMMTAPTRAGKGVGFVIPNLLSWEGSAVVLDVKGENFDITSRARVGMGDQVFRFSPFDWNNGSHRYNPMDKITRSNSFEQMFTEISILADLFLDRGNKMNDTFTEAGKSIFVAACLTAFENGKPNLGEVNRIVSSGKDKNERFGFYADEARHPLHRQLWEEAAGASNRLLSSNVQALKTAGLKQWDNPAVVRATSSSDFDFNTFRSIPQSLYMAISEDHIQTLSPLLRLMFSDLIATLRDHEPGKDEPFPVMMVIDEFQQMGAMPYIERGIHTLAGYGGRVSMITQSLASLDDIYGREGRQSLENGAGLKLYITPRDEMTVKEVSASVGKTTREAVSRSYGRHRGLLGADSISIKAEERPLLSETDARTFDPDNIIVLAPPQHPIKARRIKWFDDPVFVELTEKAKGQPLPLPTIDKKRVELAGRMKDIRRFFEEPVSNEEYDLSPEHGEETSAEEDISDEETLLKEVPEHGEVLTRNVIEQPKPEEAPAQDLGPAGGKAEDEKLPREEAQEIRMNEADATRDFLMKPKKVEI